MAHSSTLRGALLAFGATSASAPTGLGDRIRICPLFRGKADLIASTPKVPKVDLADPNTPDQRDREYTVLKYLTEDGLRLPHVIRQPFSLVCLVEQGDANASPSRIMSALSSNGPIRAAQYLRMSSDNQRYSTENQQNAIAEYAQQHGHNIVASHIDAGKSGLSLKGRGALKQLLSDALAAQRAFDAILVLDVSRWDSFKTPTKRRTTSFYVGGAHAPFRSIDLNASLGVNAKLN